MNYIGKFISNFKDFYNDINAATLTGAIDVVVVRQEDGSYLSSPFHVRFGKMGVLRSREKVVDIEINGEPVDIHMKLGETGEAFFAQELDDDEGAAVDEETCLDNYPKSDEEARSQDSGFEAEDALQDAPRTRILRIRTDQLDPEPGLLQDAAGVEVPTTNGTTPDIACESVLDASSLPEKLNSNAKDEKLDSSLDIKNQVGSTNVKSHLNLTDHESQVSSSVVDVSPINSSGSDHKVNLSEDSKGKAVSSDHKGQSSELGVVSRVPRQDSSKFVMRHTCTQTDIEQFQLVPELPKKSKPSSDAVVGDDSPGSTAENARIKVAKKSSTDTSTKGVSKSEVDSKEDPDDNSKGSRNRRKRRRRQNYKQQQQQQLQQVTGKKKGTSGSQSSDASTTSEVADLASVGGARDGIKDGCVFAMDDVDVKADVDGDTAASLRQISCAELGPSFHPFSDTDISPPPSPNSSRPGTPIKSDTEYEVERNRQEVSDQSIKADAEGNWNWTWGQLPTPPVKPKGVTTTSSTSSSSAASPSTAVAEGDPSAEESPATAGSGLSALQPYVSGAPADSAEKTATPVVQTAAAAAEQEASIVQRSMFGGMLSFMRATKKARHNPQSEGIYLEDLNPDDLDPEVAALYFPKFSAASGGSSASASVPIPGRSKPEDDVESGKGPSLPHSPQSCGDTRLVGLDSDAEHDSSPRHPVFDYKSYHDVALSLCGRLQELRDKEVPESLFLQNLVTYDDFCANTAEVLSSPDLVVRLGGAYYNWATAAPQLLALMLFQRPLPDVVKEELVRDHMPKKEPRKRSPSVSGGYSWFTWRRQTADTVETVPPPDLPDQLQASDDTVEVTAAETQTSSPSTPEMGSYQPPDSPTLGTDKGDDLPNKSQSKYKKSLRLTSQQIEQLKLHDGSNDVIFSVTTAYQGTTICRCRIYLWNYDEKIIVSDIDGTITKSDVLGHLMPIIGRDWSQGGVAQLFSKIKDNGYHFLYLSARAIGQARITRDYLRSIVQEDVSLPDGPLLLNPTSLLQAFHREVIERKPEEFKISCLRDIQALFPSTSNPFYAGYGNRINDVWAYRAVGIPISRVFTINHKGELKHELTQTFQSTYSNLSDIVHHMFPVYCHETLHHGEYSSVRYWRQPLPDCDDEINQLLHGQSSASTPA